MNSIEERLLRVAALRPRIPVQPRTGGYTASSGSEQLSRLLGGQACFSSFGSHLRVQRRLGSPMPHRVDPRAISLISCEPAESCDPGRWLFLDTETTGLSGGTGTYAFLVGLGWWEEDGFVIEQLFMRDYSEEASLLSALNEHLATGRILVTFNGKSFDWPLLQTRFRMSRIGIVREPPMHLDLLHPARRLWRLQFRSVALTHLETQILHMERGSDIPSESIPHRYFDFVRGGAAEPVADIFQHNQMDLCGLASLFLHMNGILADPARCKWGVELLGISRMLQKGGDVLLAKGAYQKALEMGLPDAAARVAQKELALMAKRERNFELSNALWMKLREDSLEGYKACEQLAIYYEHRASLPEKAALFSREALVKLREALRSGQITLAEYQKRHATLQHRLARLNAKSGAF